MVHFQSTQKTIYTVLIEAIYFQTWPKSSQGVLAIYPNLSEKIIDENIYRKKGLYPRIKN